MKKFLRTGKKALSVFMAVMMVLTAWVFFEPTKAEAATAGTYDVRVAIEVTDEAEMDNDSGVLSLYYKPDNGTQSQASTPVTETVTNSNMNTKHTVNFDFTGVKGFPSYVKLAVRFSQGAFSGWGTLSIKYYIYVYDNNSKAYTLIGESGTISKSEWSDGDDVTLEHSISQTKKPVVTEVKFLSGVTSITIPKTGASDYSTSYTAGVYDQYGVRMTYDPTIYVRSSAPTSALTSSSTITGVTMSNGTLKVTSAAQMQSGDSKSVYVHAVYGTLYANRTVTLKDPTYTFTFYNTHGGTPSPSAGSTSSAQYGHTYGSTPSGTREGFTFKGYFRDSDVADSFGTDNTSGKTMLESSTPYIGDYEWYAAWQANTYQLTFSYPNSATDYTFNNHGSQFYYSNQIVAPTPPSVVNVGVDYTYTFNNTWTAGTTTYNSSSMPKMPANDITFVANYTETIHYSDLSDLNDAIAIAKAIVDAGNGANSHQEKQYTDESWATFVQVYNNAVTMKNQNSGNGPLLSAQQSVDEMADLLNSTRPVKSKLTVVFVDEDGAIIKDGFHLVDYGTTVTAPASPTKDPDATYHYTFNSWASTDSDSLSDLNPVTHNLKFVAKFTKTAHTFTTTTASGCHGDTVTTKTCSTCGYSETTASDVTLHTWSTDYKTISPANCSTVGKEAKYCTECGAYDSSSVRDIAKTSHSFSAWTNYQAATCGAQGVQTRTCANCGQLEVQKTAATGSHTYETKHTCAATCTADGYTVKVCSVCGLTDITTTTKLSHNLTTTTTQAATCASVGVKETKCSRCEYGTTEIIPATGPHSYGAWTTISTANCISKGVKTRECTVCGKVETEITNETAHSWGAWTEVTPATCTGKGVQKRTCPTCGQSETQETAAAGHTYNSTVVAPTCTEKGYTLNVCTVCGGSYTTDEKAALGHDWADTVTVDKAATCTSEGQQSVHCNRCGAVKDVQTIAKVAHEYELKTKAATCTESGYTAYVCKNCGELDKTRDITPINPNGHTWNDGEILDADKATCEKAAVRTYTCTVCNETKREVEGSPLGHLWGTWFISTPATDTTKGEKKRQCSRDTSHFETCEIPTIGHNWEEVKTVDSTCTVAGYTEYKCTTCENCVAAIKNGGTGATQTVALPLAEHTYITETVDPTCEVAGSTVVKCSVCGHEAQSAITIPAIGHAYGAGTITTPATCTTDGVMTYTCQNDNSHTVTEAIPALGHNYDANGDGKVTAADATVTKTATCTEKGELTYTCQNDENHTYTEEIPMTAHNFAADTAASKTATCTEIGYTVMKCKNCDATYVDKATITPATGHNWDGGTEIQAPTTDSYGIKKYVCSKCGAERLETIAPIGDHVFTLESEVKPGCETTGENVWVCTAHIDCPANYTEIVPATGHNDVLDSSTTVSCISDGTAIYKCANCGRTYTLLTAYATGHNYTSEITTPATCETDGVRTYTCQNDNTHVKTEVIPKLGHKYVGVPTAPTCSAYGYTTYTCQNDNNHVYVSDFVATVAHTYAKDDAQSVPATCVSKGYDVMVCSGCGDSYKVIIDATGHDWNDGEITTAATCTANGVKTYTCNNDDTHTYTEVIPATGHTYGAGVVVREADGGNTGLIEYTCSECGDKFYEEYVTDSTIHTWTVKEQHDATCDNAGSITYKCVGCSKCTADNYATFTKQTAALGHNYVGVETTAPTCTEKGVMTYTCSRCDAAYTEEIPATGHTYGAGAVTEATCTTAGYTKYTCEDCGYEMLDNYVAPLGHQMDSHVVTAPTCTTAGWTTHSCTRTDCGYSYIDSVTEATGHDYDSAVTTEPTCEADGVKTYTCKNCAADVDGHSYTETVAKTGHAWGEWVITKYPTATEEGIKTRICANVNCPIQKETVILPKLGHTMAAGDIKVQPTCTTTGVQEYVCTEHTGDAACGYTYEVTLPALGHDWNDGKITTAATCTADGEKTYTCKRTDCGAAKTEVVPKTGHDMETAVTEATCVSDKFTTYTCKTCGYAYVINETGTALGHTFSVVVETVDATCEAKGYTIYKCERCEQTKTETTQAIGHDWGEWKTTTPATCEERGVETRVCKNNPNHIQTRRTNTVDHDFVSTLYHPTCTESGFTILACKGCGKTIRTDFVPAYGHKYDEGVYEDATCTTPGGIRYTCTNTNPDGTPCGHSYLVKDTEPLGHTWGKWHYVDHPTVEDAYAKQRDCTRGTCTVIEYERGKMSNEDDINVYYKVEFYNPWTTDTCYELNNGRTKLAKTYKTTKVNEGYYLAGTEATYPSSVLPRRDKDYTWGAYKLIDWTYDEVGQTDSALNDMKSITKNMAVYANFEGYDVYYKVRFWSGSDPLTIEQIILHGHSAQYPFDNPTKADNLHYKYEFTGWDYDYTAIYDSVGINALYNEIPKTYTMVYCDWNGDELAKEDFQYGDPAKKNPTNLERPENATYIYQFSGKWQTQPGKEEYINLNSLIVPLGTKEGDEVKVYAKYYQKAKSYVVNIYGYGINKELIPGATVQIYNSNGQIVTTTKLDEESKAIITLNYDTTYQIVITDDGGNVGKGDVELNTTMKDENGKLVPTMTTIYLKQYEDPDHGGSNCHCICHSFLGGFWISILNLIYRLTGRKIVCCYDMFATHGDKLLYGK